MRSLLTFLAVSATVLLSTAAWAQAPKEVIITNTPLPVQCEAAGSFGLVGYTTGMFTGDLGGPFGATEKCQAEFAGSRMCKAAEALATLAPLPAVRPPQAWINASQDDPPSVISSTRVGDTLYYCGSWSSANAVRGLGLTGDGRLSEPLCNTDRPIACCAVVP